MKLKYFLFICVLFCINGKAQQLSLEDCIKIGKENQPDFKIQAVKIERKKTEKRSFSSQFLPKIDASVTHAYNFGSSIDPSTNTREPSNIQSDNLSINAQVNLFDFSKWNQTKIQNLSIELEKMEFQIIENQYELLVLDKFMKALAVQEWQLVLTNQLKNAENQLNRISKEVEEGKRPKSDWYDINVIFLQEKNNLEIAKNDEVVKKTELIQLLNQMDLDVQSLTLEQPILLTSSEINTIINDYPTLKKIDLNNEKLSKEYTQLLSNFLPRVSLNYSYGTFYSQKIKSLADTNFSFGNQLKDNKSQYVGVGFSVPIYSRGDNNQLLQLNKIEQNLNNELKLKEEKRLNDLVAIETKKLQLLENLDQSLNEVLKASDQSLSTTEAKYMFDKVDASVYKSAKNQVLQANYNELNNTLDKIYIQYQLQILRGE
ncbi:TolC family protein [Chishuiella changwenlii]|uniref:TolC family protein n=1 Tax=Chishuiella changwenlii TaxID=1434701 RepID=UPI002FD9BEDC